MEWHPDPVSNDCGRSISQTQPATLVDYSAITVAKNFQRYDASLWQTLPDSLKTVLADKVGGTNLRRFEIWVGESLPEDFWRRRYIADYHMYYRSLFKVSVSNEHCFCVSPRSLQDYRRVYLEDLFHVLLEDANKVVTLMQRGISKVNSAESTSDEQTCCTVRMRQICDDMMICTPYVRSLRVYRSTALMSAQLKNVLNSLLKSVICIRVIFLQNYQAIRETIECFIKYGNILDFHTNWQPQHCSLPPWCSLELLNMLSGLTQTEVDNIDTSDDESPSSTSAVGKPATSTTCTKSVPSTSTELKQLGEYENPYDLYDMAVTGMRMDRMYKDITFDCALKQSYNSVTHISISSFILTMNSTFHQFVTKSLLPRWHSLQSIKLSALNYNIDVDSFKEPIIYLIEHHNLTKICFEDSQFDNPMNLFIAIIRLLIRRSDIVLNRLTLLGVGHSFQGDYSAEIDEVGYFNGIESLDLSFSALNHTPSIQTLCSYIKNDRSLTSLNLNCSQLPSGGASYVLHRAIAVSCIRELILDFNPINHILIQDSVIYMLTENRNFTVLSFTLCSFNEIFLRERFFPALTEQTHLEKLYLAENRIGDKLELKEFIINLLKSRKQLQYLDLSSNYLSGPFLVNLADNLLAMKHSSDDPRKPLFEGLNINFNLDRGEVVKHRDLVRRKFKELSKHFFCQILYEDTAAAEHMAQM